MPKLQNLLYISLEENDSSSSSSDDHAIEGGAKRHKHSDGSSSSDDNDSTAAAHAAATGHSPQPRKPIVASLPKVQVNLKKESPEEPDKKSNSNIVDSEATKGTQAVESAKGVGEVNADSSSNNKSTDENYSEATPEGKLAPIRLTSNSAAEISAPALAEEPRKEAELNCSDGLTGDVDELELENKTNAIVVTANGAAKESKTVAAGMMAPKTKKLELNRDISLNERDEDENTALHVAIHTRKLEHVKVLLEAGASYRIRCDGSLPIHTAISIGALRAHRQFAYECVVLLHEHGADLTVKDDAVHTPLFLACMFNLPQIVSYVLSDDEGLSTLNTRADRAGNRPLHAAAKFDTLDNPSFSKTAASIATGQARTVPHHHPDGSVVNSLHLIPRFPGKLESSHQRSAVPAPVVEGLLAGVAPSTEALLTQVLLGTNGIEVDALNVLGQTPLHVACMRRNWPVARLLLQAGASPITTDRRGHTPGELAYKRAMPIPNDLADVLGDPPESGIVPPLRELIVDPDGSTVVLCHELCMLHRTCPPIQRDSAEPPPENVRRLHVLVDPETGILRAGEFGNIVWMSQARRAAIADVLKVSLLPFLHTDDVS